MKVAGTAKYFTYYPDPLDVESCDCPAVEIYSERKRICGERNPQNYICTSPRRHGGEHHSHAEPGKIFVKW